MTPATRFVLLNSPHNPTGTVLTRAELQAVAELAIEHDLVVITDEVYEHLTFDGAEHVPIATLPGMFERTLTLSSAGKSYSFTGWKVGWATGPAELVGAVLAAKQWLTFTSGLPAAAGGRAGAGRGAATSRSRWPRDLQERRDLLVAGLRGRRARRRTSRRAPTSRHRHRSATSAGTTAWPSAWRCPSGPAWWRSRAGLLRRPGRPGRGRHLVRWAFCKTREVIGEGVARLAKADLGA